MKQKLYLILAGLFLLTVQVKAQAPNSLNYQGVARDVSGNVIANQSVGIRFTIHQGSAVGTSIYQETQSGMTNQFGLFTLELGEGTVTTGDFDTINWSSNTEYLEVEMDASGGSNYIDMGTTPLLSVPYALYSAKAGTATTAATATNATNATTAIYSDTAQYAANSEYSDTAEFAKNVGKTTWTLSGTTIYNNNTGVVGVGTATPSAKSELDVISAHQYGAVFNSDSLSNSSSVINAAFTGTGKFNAAAVTGASTPSDGYGYGGVFTGGATGVTGTATSTSTATVYGASGTATATSGHPYGVAGTATDKGAGTAYGVYGTATSASGIAYGLYGVGNPVGGFGTASGAGVIFPELGTPYGASPYLRVAGIAGEVLSGTASSGYETDGVLGVATSTGGSYKEVGLCGYGTNATGEDIGVFAGSQATGNEYYSIAVFGYCNPNTSGPTAPYGNYGAYFYGDVYSSGTLSAANKQFKIDDPLDPANKYLYHSCVESPDMMNVYNGNVTTDANGNATVTLPEYFQAENKDFKYQLTVIGQFAQAIVATEVSNNQFTVKTDKPNVKVSWQVSGVRQDPYANNNRTVAEVAKKGIEKGHYLYPQYYGQPQSLSINDLVAGSQNLATLKANTVAPASAATQTTTNASTGIGTTVIK